MPHPTRYLRVDSARLQFGDRVDRIGDFLLVADPLADAAVASLGGLPRAQMFELIDVGCTRGAAALPSTAPAALRHFFAACEQLPAWVDHRVMTHGGSVVLRYGLLAGMVLAARGIVLGYASPGGNKPLVLTGGLTERAARRLNETARFLRAVIGPDGMQRFAPGYAATLHVRLMHAWVRASLHRNPLWRMHDWGVAINQHDMAATTLLFSMIVIDGLRSLGAPISLDEEEAYSHLWRYTGHLMGVDHELLPTGPQDGRRLWAVIQHTQGRPDDDSRALVRALVASVGTEAKTAKEKRQAWLALHLLRTVAFMLHGDELAMELGFVKSPLGLASRSLPSLMHQADKLARRFPAWQLRAGERYWNEFGNIGARVYGTPFRY